MPAPRRVKSSRTVFTDLGCDGGGFLHDRGIHHRLEPPFGQSRQSSSCHASRPKNSFNDYIRVEDDNHARRWPERWVLMSLLMKARSRVDRLPYLRSGARKALVDRDYDVKIVGRHFSRSEKWWREGGSNFVFAAGRHCALGCARLTPCSPPVRSRSPGVITGSPTDGITG